MESVKTKTTQPKGMGGGERRHSSEMKIMSRECLGTRFANTLLVGVLAISLQFQ